MLTFYPVRRVNISVPVNVHAYDPQIWHDDEPDAKPDLWHCH